MRFLWLGLTIALAACSGDGISVTREQGIVPYVEIHLRYLGSLGAVQTTVLANPFTQDGDGEAVRHVLTSTRVEPYLRYTAARPANDVYGYRLVVAFGGWPAGGDNYCRNPDLSPRAAPAVTTEMHAVLCLGSAPLSEAAARTRRVASPDDPRFARLVSDLLVGLMVSSQRNDMDQPPS
jgi:hypothetical protein